MRESAFGILCPSCEPQVQALIPEIKIVLHFNILQYLNYKLFEIVKMLQERHVKDRTTNSWRT